MLKSQIMRIFLDFGATKEMISVKSLIKSVLGLGVPAITRVRRLRVNEGAFVRQLAGREGEKRMELQCVYR